MGRSEARKTCGASSTWRGARGGGATCKAVIVDRVDDFLYFGAVMLSVKGWEEACEAARVGGSGAQRVAAVGRWNDWTVAREGE